jgi:imidazolonepropionase-like amidohydrolase
VDAPATLAAVVEAAHAAGLPVAAHAGHILTADEAVRIGVDALEHVRIGPELLSEEKRDALKPLRTRDRLRPWTSGTRRSCSLSNRLPTLR